MSKYVSKENLQQYDAIIKGYIKDKLQNDEMQLDIYSYGIQWKPNTNQPVRIGNPLYHKSLPIQSQMRGCIAKGKVINYYLNPTDWEEPYENAPNIKSVKLNSYTDTILTFNISNSNAIFSIGNKVRCYNDDTIVEGIITSINSTQLIVTFESIKLGNLASDQTYTIVRMPRLDGYDGQVMIEIPKFYLWSTTSDTAYSVRISEKKLVDYALEIPHLLLSAYKVTLLRSVPENMGWLSTLQANTAVSIMNKNAYCRGGSNRSNRDTLNEIQTDLQKPVTNQTKQNMELYARKSDGHILCYEYYKAIFYWLFAIEYCTFNCQNSFNANLTSDGYHQGGLGAGVTNLSNSVWSNLNSYNPVTPIGITNKIGNESGAISIKYKDDNLTYPNRYRGLENPFGDVWLNLSGCCMITIDKISKLYTTTNPELYNQTSTLDGYVYKGTFGSSSNYVGEFDIQKQGELIIKDGASYQSSKFDYFYTNLNNGLFTLLLGGGACSGSYAGFGYALVNGGLSTAWSIVAFRTYTIIDD